VTTARQYVHAAARAARAVAAAAGEPDHIRPVCVRGAKGPLTAGDQQVIDRFGEFLALRAAIDERVADGRYVKGQQLPAWHRYALRLAAWRMEHVADA